MSKGQWQMSDGWAAHVSRASSPCGLRSLTGWKPVIRKQRCAAALMIRAATIAPKKEIRLIQVMGFHKTYKQTFAVADLSFDVMPGQILGLLGPNGAGKTTTMRAIAGIIPPTLGRLFVAGRDVQVDPVGAKQALAYVPDDPKLFEALTVWEHLKFVASAYRVDKFEPHAEWLLGQFELTEQRNKMAGELSRGMRQKVAICCAYLPRPAAILFDEPLTGLDPKGIRVMKESVRQIAAAGAAVVVSSHLLALVEDLVTHLLILHKGKRLFFGAAAAARQAFAVAGGGDASLEDVFLRATEQQPAAGPAAPVVNSGS